MRQSRKTVSQVCPKTRKHSLRINYTYIFLSLLL